jgi:hypothetical protein
MPLSGVSCSPAAGDYDCSAALPSLPAGSYVLEMAAIEPATGGESARSESIVFNGSPTAPREVISSTQVIGQRPSNNGPWLSCFSGDSSTCVAVSVAATELAAVERMVTLPDERVLATFAGGVIQVLPGSEPQRLDINRGQPVNIAAVATDPDFLTNRFVYLASVAASADGRDAVSIIRTRELAGGLGEAATIAGPFPVAQGRLAMSIGPDRCIYLALASAGAGSSGGGSYDGLVLRFTRNGAAAGYERMSSPVLATGSDAPSSFAWLDATHLLLASGTGMRGITVGVVPLRAESGWLPPAARLGGRFEGFAGRVIEIGAAPAVGDAISPSNLFLLAAQPAALYLARLTRNPGLEVSSVNPVSLGPWTPAALAIDRGGDAIVAAHKTGDRHVTLLRVHAQ